jgi:hypothetical protein
VEEKRDRYSRKYICVINNTHGTVTSNEAVLTVIESPGTVFSQVQYFGDSANYTPKNKSNWDIVVEDGDVRYFINTYCHDNDTNKVDEYNIIKNRTYSDFVISVEVKTAENIGLVTGADYCFIFGWQDSNNYYYVRAAADQWNSRLYVVENGNRRDLGMANSKLIPDENWHVCSVGREGSKITVKIDGVIKLGPISDSTFLQGSIGIGSYNDAAYFDNIREGWADAPPPPPTTPPTTPPITTPEEIDVKVYPNPYMMSGSNSITFSVSGSAGTGGEVKIYTISGKLVKKLLIQSGFNEVNWDVLNEEGNSIATGLYIYTTTDGNGNKKTGKLAINH